MDTPPLHQFSAEDLSEMLAPPASTTQDQVTESEDSEPMMIEEEIETKLEDLGCKDILKKLTKSAVNFMQTDPSRKAVFVGPIIKLDGVGPVDNRPSTC